MLDLDRLVSSQFLIAALALIAVAGTLFTLLLPLFERDGLKTRMKSVALEREKLRARERARLAAEKSAPRASLRSEPKAQIKNIVDRLNLKAKLADEQTSNKLRMAGYRGSRPLYTFLFARVALPAVLLIVSLFYAFAILPETLPTMTKIGGSIVVSGFGVFLPNIYIQNKITNRQRSIRRAWPDALDLMLICVESGMSIEAAFGRVAEEIGAQSIPLAEEMTLTNAELSFLSERRQAYENLVSRTGVEGVKNVMMAL
ncbi:MAG: type II secretion system F family protein, partial [Gammaproteobacteria bacterium]|nr:type II secretion system F family protein [Gammaproteobacteria bacterium]